MNTKISVLRICVEAIVYFLLDILHDCTFNKATLLRPHWSFTLTSQYRDWKANKYSTLTVSELGPNNSLVLGLRGSSCTHEVTKKKSWTLFQSSFDLINTRNKNYKTLNSTRVFISFKYTRNKKKDSSTQV